MYVIAVRFNGEKIIVLQLESQDISVSFFAICASFFVEE